jgi:hypothetical protein
MSFLRHERRQWSLKIIRELRQPAWMIVVLVMFLIATITGCQITFSPKHYTVKGTIAPLASEKGRIIFYRPGSFLWYGHTERPDILLDGQKVGISQPGTVFYVDVEPGEYRATIPAATYTGEVSVDVDVSKGETVYVKNTVGASLFAGRMKIKLVDPEEAMTEIEGLEFMAHPMK